jgi:transcriptional repressor NrdR
MNCPSCGESSRVLETRSAEDGTAVRRRRECEDCGERFTTYERREPDPLFVRKRGGERQRFDRTKLRAALLRAAHKRPVTAHDVERIVERIERQVAAAGGELSANRVGELCLEDLRELDLGAYLQYAGTLPVANEELAAAAATYSAPGSVRARREYAESTLKAVQRRGLDE